jgi:hypothetical protein
MLERSPRNLRNSLKLAPIAESLMYELTLPTDPSP